MSIPDWIDPPAPGMPDPIIKYYDDGKTVKFIGYGNKQNLMHREGAPAEITYHPNGLKKREEWYLHGLVHYNLRREWRQDGTEIDLRT